MNSATATGRQTRQAGEGLAGQADLVTAINSTPFMMTRCSRELRYLFASEAYARMLGRRPEEVIGSNISDIVGEKGFATILPHIEKVLRGERVEYEAEVHFKGIGPRLLHVIYTPDLDHGVVHGWVASIVDVSDQRRADDRIAADLSAMTRLRQVGTLCVREGENVDKCLHENSRDGNCHHQRR